MKSNKYKLFLFLLILWGVITSISAVLLWRDNQKLKEANNLLSESNVVLKKMVANEYKSYQAINDCFVVKKGLCDPEDFKSQLQTLGDEADGLYDQIAAFDQQLKVQSP